MPLEALIFDVDGTLAETEEAHRHAFNAAFADAGLGWHWDVPTYSRLLEVTGGKERIRHYIDQTPGLAALDAAALGRLHAAKSAHYVDAVQGGTIALRPGVRRLLLEARDAGLRLAIATTTSPGNVQALLLATLGQDGPGLFEVVGAGDDVPRKKPAPDIYQLVLDRLGLTAMRCIAFEDTPNGLHAAHGAGIQTVVTASLYGGTDGFEDASMVLDSLGDAGAPCRVLAGPPLPGPMLDVPMLRGIAKR
ncbi:MAG: HAD-IA family hydrolase [Gemmatimonadaceae bacterium]|nr:HAD-IA family hydrolase [Acetobacteraceae bacterium]